MTLNDLIIRGRGLIPEVDSEVLPSSSTTQLSMTNIFNDGAQEFAKLTRCLPKERFFDVVASNPTYQLTTEVNDFYTMKEEGLWHNRSGSDTNWYRVKPMTIRALDQKFPTWRNQSSSDMVMYYSQDGDTLRVFYTPTFSKTNGFWLYYYATSSDMTAATDYPFTGNSTHSTRLSPYEKNLLVYYEYRALGIMGYKDDALKKEQEWYQLCEKGRSELDTRRDLAQNSSAKVVGYGRGRNYRRSY